MPEFIEINGDTYEPLITEEQIRARIKELAVLINKDYAGKTVTVIGVLNGSFIFLADLVREFKIDCEIDFLKISSYSNSKITSGEVKMLKNLNCDISGRNILIVEDIVDSGLSIQFIKNMIEKESPKTLRFVSLLLKTGLQKIDFSVDYIGFKIPPDFVIGYGLDYGQKVRNLRSVYRLVRSKTAS